MIERIFTFLVRLIFWAGVIPFFAWRLWTTYPDQGLWETFGGLVTVALLALAATLGFGLRIWVRDLVRPRRHDDSPQP